MSLAQASGINECEDLLGRMGKGTETAEVPLEGLHGQARGLKGQIGISCFPV